MIRISSSLSLFCLALSCSPGDGAPLGEPDAASDDFDRQALLAHVAETVLAETYGAFAVRAEEVHTATEAYCAALGTESVDSARSAAMDAWRAAMLSWQRAQLMQVGPAVDETTNIGDVIYSWPVISSCAVDQEVMSLHDDPDGFDMTTRLTNRRGLDAAEYALFATSLEATCPPQVQPEGWDELSEDNRRAARCSYLVEVASDLASQGGALALAWAGGDRPFADQLALAGTDASSFASEREALNAVFGALFYLDTELKDQKLAEPVGLLPNSCNTDRDGCPEELESQYARHSKENIAANLEGFRMLFRGQSKDGEEGLGFDEFLEARGAAHVATAISEAIAAAEAAVEAIPGNMSDALESNYDDVAAAHAAVKAITDPLKEEVPGLLDLEIPTEAGGDND